MPRGRGRRADYSWFSTCGVVNSMDLAVNTVGLGNGAIAVTTPLTITRIHGYFTAQLDAGGVDERAMIAFGIIKVSNEALAAGAGSIPSPDTDADAEWIVHGHLWVTSGAEAAIVNEGLFDRKVVDSKAMRKAKPSDSLAVMFETCITNDQTGTVDLTYGIRVLSAE